MTYNDTFIRACYGQTVDHIPVWYMRQAGRYDPEYRKIKEKHSLLEICRQPELAARVTMLPVHKLGVDAAILYSDIMNPVASIGIEFDIVPNVGPVIDTPIRSKQDVVKLKPIDVENDLQHILETIRILDRELQVPLIGFAGAPFTLASYLIEGRPSRNYLRTKQLMYTEPDTWHLLMNKLGDVISTYLKAQIKAGAKAVQLFDSWAGSLAPQDYKTYVLPVIERIFNNLSSEKGVPSIYFPGVGSGELLPLLKNVKADVISVDWRVALPEASRRLGNQFTVQGNLDPLVLMADWPKIQGDAALLIEEGLDLPGYVFNLGHGLFPEAPIDQLQRLTSFVQSYSAERINETKTVNS
jgi:uroporphyrinogen decarboxylase